MRSSTLSILFLPLIIWLYIEGTTSDQLKIGTKNSSGLMAIILQFNGNTGINPTGQWKLYMFRLFGFHVYDIMFRIHLDQFHEISPLYIICLYMMFLLPRIWQGCPILMLENHQTSRAPQVSHTPVPRPAGIPAQVGCKAGSEVIRHVSFLFFQGKLYMIEK